MKGTDKQMVSSGEWVKVGRKAYRHVSGVEITHDGMCWVTNGKRYTTLWAARLEAEGK